MIPPFAKSLDTGLLSISYSSIRQYCISHANAPLEETDSLWHNRLSDSVKQYVNLEGDRLPYET